VIEPVELNGLWWLPNNPEKKLPGKLIFSQESGAELELLGVFGTERSPKVEETKIILGLTQEGKPVTLHDCYYLAWNIPWNLPTIELGGSRFRAKYVFEGAHFEKEADIKFNQLYGNFTDLDAWVNINGFSIDHNTIDGRFEFTIKYTKPAPRFMKIDDRYEVGVDFSSHGPKSSIVQADVNITQRTYLVVKTKEDLPFEDLYNVLNKFTHLIQIGIQRITYPIMVFGFTKANIEDNKEQKLYSPEVNIYYQPVEAYAEKKSLIPQEMLFTFDDLDEILIKNWFKVYDKFQTAIHLHRSLYYSNRLFIETRFLNIAQALESLHSILFDNQYIPMDEFKRRREVLLDTIPAELKDWTTEILAGANYKRFRLKILELIEKKEHIFSQCILDKERFVQHIRDTRNEFVHQSKQRWTLRDKEALVSAIFLLSYLFESHMLEIIGFSDEKATDLFKPQIKKYLSRWKTF
jgi:hypothetical protein